MLPESPHQVQASHQPCGLSSLCPCHAPAMPLPCPCLPARWNPSESNRLLWGFWRCNLLPFSSSGFHVTQLHFCIFRFPLGFFLPPSPRWTLGRNMFQIKAVASDVGTQKNWQVRGEPQIAPCLKQTWNLWVWGPVHRYRGAQTFHIIWHDREGKPMVSWNMLIGFSPTGHLPSSCCSWKGDRTYATSAARH